MLRWFSRNARDLPWRRRSGLYAIWVSEVMLQQTRVETVVPYYRRFLRRFPTPGRLAAATLLEVLKAWEGLGYYSRARNLQRAARLVAGRHGGRVPDGYAEFRSLPGVGEYIAAAVLSIGAGLALPVVDGNVLRVVSRWQGIVDDIRLPATRRRVRAFLEGIIPAADPGRFNEAMMEVGALVCLPRAPRCPACPLRPGCFAQARGRTGSLPVKGKKKPLPEYEVALAVILRRNRIFVQQRPVEGHLGGLWEFPGGKRENGESLAACLQRELREELAIETSVGEAFGEYKHAYTHFRVRLFAFHCTITQGKPQLLHASELQWAAPQDLVNFPMGKIDRQIARRLTDLNPGSQ